MANKLITIRLGNKLLKEIDSALDHSSFDNRTEFIKHAVRELLDEVNSGPVKRIPSKGEGSKDSGLEEIVNESMSELKYVR